MDTYAYKSDFKCRGRSETVCGLPSRDKLMRLPQINKFVFFFDQTTASMPQRPHNTFRASRFDKCMALYRKTPSNTHLHRLGGWIRLDARCRNHTFGASPKWTGQEFQEKMSCSAKNLFRVVRHVCEQLLTSSARLQGAKTWPSGRQMKLVDLTRKYTWSRRPSSGSLQETSTLNSRWEWPHRILEMKLALAVVVMGGPKPTQSVTTLVCHRSKSKHGFVGGNYERKRNITGHMVNKWSYTL